MRANVALIFGLSLAHSVAAQDSSQLDAWIDALGGEREAALVAGRQLQGAGEPALRKLETRWARLSPKSKRRAVPFISAMTSESARARGILALAARDQDEQLANDAFTSLARRGRVAHDALLSLVPYNGVGDRAARWLAEQAPATAIPALFRALDTPAASDRPALREALAKASQTRAADAATHGLSWLAGKPSPTGASLAAEATASRPNTLALFDALRGYAFNHADGFETRWRLARLAGETPHHPALRDWLRELLDDEHWMLRSAATKSLAAQGDWEAVRSALQDPYPRVRVAALRALKDDNQSLVSRASAARRDIWPFVRAAAVESIASADGAQNVVIAAIEDQHSVVRAVAIQTLATRSDQNADPKVVARLRARDEWSPVTQAAIRYVEQRCLHDGDEALIEVAQRGLTPTASDEARHNTSRAISALRALGTPASERFLKRLAEMPDAPRFVGLALDRPATLCTPHPAGS